MSMPYPKAAPRSPVKAIYIRLNDALAEAVEAEQARYGLSATDIGRIALARMFEAEDEEAGHAA
jgi:hypothetical protein